MSLRFRILAAPAEVRAGWLASAAGQWAEGPSEERVFELASEPDEVRVGRRPDVEIELPFPSVSSLHARLLRGAAPGDWWVEDLGSTNGTWLDGARVEPGRSHPVRAGQRLRIATVDVVYDGWSAGGGGRGAASTASIARRLIGDLLAVVGGASPTLGADRGGGSIPSSIGLLERGRRYLAGRAASCDIVLASEHASREHAAFVRGEGGVLVSDLGSRNGVLVNGIAISGVTRLFDGDRIDVGGVVLRLADPEDRYLQRLRSVGDEPPSDPPAPVEIEIAIAKAPGPPVAARTAIANDADPPAAAGTASAKALDPPLAEALGPQPGPKRALARSREPAPRRASGAIAGQAPDRKSGRRAWLASAVVAAIALGAIAGLLVLLLLG